MEFELDIQDIIEASRGQSKWLGWPTRKSMMSIVAVIFTLLGLDSLADAAQPITIASAFSLPARALR